MIGFFYWQTVDDDGVLDPVENPSAFFGLSDVVCIFVGKQTETFLLKDTEDNKAFSIQTSTACFDFHADTPAIRNTWLKELRKVAKHAKIVTGDVFLDGVECTRYFHDEPPKLLRLFIDKSLGSASF